MRGKNGGAGQGTFRPSPKSDETLVPGFNGFLGDPDCECELKMTEAGEFYLYQHYRGKMPPPKSMEEMISAYAAHVAGDVEEHVLIRQLSRAEAIQWVLDCWLPEQFEDNVRIVCEEAES